TYEYDALGNPIQVTDAQEHVLQLAYDAMNRLGSIANPIGGVYTLRYNAEGQPITATDEDGRTYLTEFDNFLRSSKQTDGLGHTTTERYNLPDGSLGSLYQPTEIQYPTYTKRTRYDARERPTSDTLFISTQSGTEGRTRSTRYDPRGRVISETDENGHTRNYGYDAHGQLMTTTDSLGNKVQTLYDI
ncbi:hypothetical protein, partial [Chitiniphilus shinanonensis]|uniref:hypothetical protein n=1 Tax=Chitiniphilus shinanonensis TaxID=553088 RepID=UPI00333EDC31